jgi:hypothetical protein
MTEGSQDITGEAIMTHDDENDRNAAWLRKLMEGLAASNSSAEDMVSRLYAFAHSGRKIIAPFLDPIRVLSRSETGVPTVHIEVFATEIHALGCLLGGETAQVAHAVNADMLTALKAIKNGLADTSSSTIEKRMTLITKAEAWLLAHNAIAKVDAEYERQRDEPRDRAP